MVNPTYTKKRGETIMYQMKPEYYTGIEAIDQEHTRLFELAQQTHDLLNNDILIDKAEDRKSVV